MTDIENRLRDRLADAATAAPRFHGLTAEPRALRARLRNRSTLTSSVAAAVVLLVGGVGVAWWAAGRAGDSPRDATCPAQLVLAGRTYVGRGPVVRMPRPGPGLGTARPVPCKDSEGRGPTKPVEAFTVPGVPATAAILTDDGIWLGKDLRTVPPAIQELDTPVRCTGAGAVRATGKLVSIDAQPVGQDFSFQAPYTAQLVLTDGNGDGPLLKDYQAVTIEVSVSSATASGEDRGLLRATLGDGRAVTAVLRCDRARFRATSLALAP